MENAIEVKGKDFSQTWRYKLGVFLIVLGHIILLGGLLAPTVLKVSVATVGFALITGEIITFSSIVFLGMEGFKTIKSKVFRFLKASYVADVGPKRHYIGIALFFVCMVTTYVTIIYAWIAFNATIPTQPAPIVWGLSVAQQKVMVLSLFFIGEVSLLISFYVLGARWWEKLRELVIWKPNK